MAELARLHWKGDEFLKLTEAQASRRLKMACIMVTNTAKENLTPGGPSGFKTSHGGSGLRGSIKYEVEGLEGRVGSNLRYARIQELGGITPPHVFGPRFKKALKFPIFGAGTSGAWSMGGFGELIRKRVAHPGSHIPPRPYLRPALWSNETEIRALFARPIK